MKVILSNFRHYAGGERFTWRFEAGKAYHVGGNSGRGKSTIFNAIYWCLYGKEERVVPFTDPSAKTWVSIKDLSPAFPLIQRSCNPARFSLKVGGSGKMLQGSPAQLHLIAHFGCADTWLATHYMRQLSLTHLLALPATKRMKVVSQITYRGHDPLHLLQQFNHAIQMTESDLRVHTSKYEQAKVAFKKLSKEGRGHIDPSYALEGEELVKLKGQLKETKLLVVTLGEKRDQIQRYHASYATFESLIVRLRRELSDLPEPDESRLKELGQLKAAWILKTQAAQLAKRKREELAKLANLVGSQPAVYTSDELTQAVAQARLHTEMKIKSAQAGLARYEPRLLKKELAGLELALDLQWVWPHLERKTKLEQELTNLQGKVSFEITPEKLTKFKEELADLERSRDLVTCPACSTSLRFVSGDLEPAEGTAFNAELYSSLERKCTLARNHLKGQARIGWLEEQLAQIPELPPIPEELQTPLRDPKGARSRLDLLRKLRYVELPPVDPNHMKNCITWHRLQAELDEIEESTSSSSSSSACSDPTPELEQLQAIKIRRHQTQRRLADLERQLAALEKPDLSLEEVEAELSQLAQTKKELKLAGKRSNLTSKAKLAYEELKELNRKVAKTRQKVLDLKEMRQLVSRQQHDSLTKVIQSVNVVLKRAAPKLFQEAPVKIWIDLVKKIKSTGVEKPFVGVKVAYKGCPESAFEAMSGGEKARVSILVAAAFHLAAGDDLLILDEPLSGLGNEDKDTVLEVLTELLKGHTLLVAAHAVPTGLFDRRVAL